MVERILITGGAGFIGLALARAALERGNLVTLLDNFARGRQDAAFAELRGHVQVIDHDLTRPLPEHLPGGPYSAVYHLAAVVGVQQSNTAPQHVLRTNLLSTLHLLDWCERARPAALFFSSTSEVADGAVRTGLAELPSGEDLPMVIDEPLRPRSGYAMSKMAGELLCIHTARAYGIRVRVGRYHNIYGPRMGYDHVIPQLIVRALEQSDPFVLYGPQQYRSFCYIDDAVRATLDLMELAEEQPLLVNIGNGQEMTQLADLAQAILTLANVAPQIQPLPAPPGSPDKRRPDTTRLTALTGYQPQVPLAVGLQHTFAWYHHAWQTERQSR
ncbi:MAG: NAD-dependent epimerase/dehydratase family protein [Roseiflexaceae bacterium]